VKPLGTPAVRDTVRKARDAFRRATGQQVPLVYAGVLDGESLWLAAEAPDGELAARHQASGELIPLEADLVDRVGQLTAFRAELTTLREHAPAEFDLVLVGEPGKVSSLAARPAPAGPLVTPPTRDGRHQFTLQHDRSGTLQLRVATVRRRAELVGVQVVPEGVALTVRGVPDNARDLTLRDDQGVVRASFPLVVEDGIGRGVLTPDRLPDSGPVFAKVAVGADQALPIARSRNELRHPNDAVLLPDLLDTNGNRSLAKLRWSPQGALAIRLTCLEPEADGSEE
jgi:hypothetical protein